MTCIVTKRNLEKHERIQTGEKPYKCRFSGCRKAFTQIGHLQCHERTHTGEKPFQCTFTGCGKAFAQSRDLKAHERMHTGEKPYKCTFLGCESAFSDPASLKRHQPIHTGEKPFKCTFAGCNYTSSRSSSLKLHERIHTGEKPFKCRFSGCLQAFESSSHLKRHERTVHKLDLPARRNRVVVRSGAEDEVLSQCRFCASSVLKEDSIECVKCGEICHFSCASQLSLFVMSAVRAVDFDQFLCDQCFNELDPSSQAKLLFPRSASVVLHHTSVSSDGSCTVLHPHVSPPFTLVLARTHNPTLTGSHRSLGLFLRGRVGTNELVAIISGVIVPEVSSSAVFTRSDGVLLDTSRSPLPSCRIRRSSEFGNCLAEDGKDDDGTPIIEVYALCGIENEELVLWEGRERTKEAVTDEAGEEAELERSECGCEVSTIDVKQEGDVLGGLQENGRQREEGEESVAIGTVKDHNDEETTRKTLHQHPIHNMREDDERTEDAVRCEGDSNTVRLFRPVRPVLSSIWLDSTHCSAEETEGMDAERERWKKKMFETFLGFD
ncbi:putative Zinc finger protein [Blattamonas nauphoetae]|uniref:Zinc finger protein n=1 Tax=Blattamonas nauphoetae TaxID=2049346 RepID=A0ABQ9XKJ4_9EUKA|nr:putative Zinc finger protein [Blattamonas nauphoetae]